MKWTSVSILSVQSLEFKSEFWNLDPEVFDLPQKTHSFRRILLETQLLGSGLVLA